MTIVRSMRELNIAGLDLNLVPALDALLRHRNVTRAAEEVGLSQPAMSRALGRLRELHDDPLLVRVGSGYVLTHRAQTMQPQLALAVSHLREVFQKQAFDPGLEKRTLKIAAADTQTVLLLPGVMQRLALEAPAVDVRVEAPRPDTIGRLQGGELDLAFALSSMPLPPGTNSEVVFEDELALVMRRGHPAADKAWSIEDYGSYRHVGVAILGDGVSEIDALLAARGVTRRIAFVTPHFMAALAAVGASDMVTTVSATLARRFAPALKLVMQRPPFEDALLHTTLVYSHARASDPFLTWFRSVVAEVAMALPR